MTSKIINPFKPTRWEHHSEKYPLIWFTPTASHLAEDKSAFVSGSRGSGKTTLLRSVCWEDILNNPSLKLQKSLSDFRHIGIYIRLPDHVSASMNLLNWDSVFPDTPNSDLEFYRFFSLALELICIEKSLAAIQALRLAGQIQFDAVQETSLVTDFKTEFPKLSEFAGTEPVTFIQLGQVCRTVVRRLNEACGRGYLKDVIPLLPPREPNELLSTFIERLSGVARVKFGQEVVTPGFKFCLDDCEVLSELQRKVVNSLVRKSRFPISWVICAVGDLVDLGNTFVSEQPLTDADRRVISLDDRNRTEFSDLCQAVASLRVFFSLSKDKRESYPNIEISKFFSLNDRLGILSVNEIIGEMLNRSTSPLADLVKNAGHILHEVLARSDNKPVNIDNQGVNLPYYEAYILWHWTGHENSFVNYPTEKDLSRVTAYASYLSAPNIQAWIRRKMVGVLLHLASTLGFKRLPLGGANIIISLSDGSIRDFLEIMSEIFERYIKDRKGKDKNKDFDQILDKFAKSTTKIPIRVQTDGIYISSEAFFNGIGSPIDIGSQSMSKLINVLGDFTSLLQGSSGDISAVATAERGVFIIDRNNTLNLVDGKKSDFIRDIFSRAELSGYLRSSLVKKTWIIKNKRYG